MPCSDFCFILAHSLYNWIFIVSVLLYTLFALLQVYFCLSLLFLWSCISLIKYMHFLWSGDDFHLTAGGFLYTTLYVTNEIWNLVYCLEAIHTERVFPVCCVWPCLTIVVSSHFFCNISCMTQHFPKRSSRKKFNFKKTNKKHLYILYLFQYFLLVYPLPVICTKICLLFCLILYTFDI